MTKKKIIISDCDGILTDGNSIYTSEGKIAKIYGAYDSEAIEYAYNEGWEIKFVTNDKTGSIITERRVSQYVDKGYATFTIASASERFDIVKAYKDNGYYVVFVGDSVSDIKTGEISDLFATTNNALDIVKSKANYVSKRNGGDGGFAEIVYYVCGY